MREGNQVTCDEVAGVTRKLGAMFPSARGEMGWVVYGITIALGIVTALLIVSPTVKWLEQGIRYLGRIF